ncbi:Mce associated membrane protein [Mycobacteroides abscessus subsp. abscessus]|nr:Mce associated membrane protein [Mycobacteroides abscessus subsp. abscessus]
MTVDVEERPAAVDEADAAVVEAETDEAQRDSRKSWARWAGLALAVAAMLLAVAAGYFKWQDDSVRLAQTAATESVRAAGDGTVAMLSYRPETVDTELKSAADRLTGSFRGEYTKLVDTVVAPGAKQKHISAVATVPDAASVSATENHAVVLVFVNQTTTIGADAPTASTSTVRVTLDKVHDRWLISQFDPV